MDPIRIPRVEYAEPADGYYMRVFVPAPVGQIIESDQIVPGSQIYSAQIIDSSQIYESAQIIDSSQIYDSAGVIDSAMVNGGAYNIQGVPIIDGSQLRNSDGTYIQGVTVYNGGENTHAQNNFYGTNSSGATGVIDIEPTSMVICSNQHTGLNSSSYRQGSGLNYTSSSNISNNNENTDDYRIMTLTGGGGGYTIHRDNSLDDDDSMKLKCDAPLEIANVDNFVMQNMPDMENLDTLNFEFDMNAIDLDSGGNFPGLDLENSNLSQETPVESYKNVNSVMTQHQPISTSSTVPRVTIHTKRIRKPRNNIIEEESASTNLSTITYPPLEMLGITTPEHSQASNDNIEYNTPIPHISPIYKEESQSPSYSSPVSPSPSTSSSYGSSRASLSTMSDAERYRHIRNQNNESSRIYRQKKKMNIKESEAELLLLQKENTRLKEVYNAVKQKKDIAQSLMRGFVQDASKHRKQ